MKLRVEITRVRIPAIFLPRIKNGRKTTIPHQRHIQPAAPKLLRTGHHLRSTKPSGSEPKVFKKSQNAKLFSLTSFS